MASTSQLFAVGGTVRSEYLEPDTQAALETALHWATETHWDSLRTPHVFMGLLARPDRLIVQWAERLGFDLANLLEQFAELFQQPHSTPGRLRLHREFLSDNAIDVLRAAWTRCQEAGRERIRLIDLLIELFRQQNSIVAGCFEEIGFSAEVLTQTALVMETES